MSLASNLSGSSSLSMFSSSHGRRSLLYMSSSFSLKLNRLVPLAAGRGWSYHNAASRNHTSNRHHQQPVSNSNRHLRERKQVSSSLQAVPEKEEDEQGSRVLRPGMVLLKEHLALEEQISIVKECRSLGLGPGGFYKINARRMLMCLGLDWDPKTSKCNKIRRFDNATVPKIPREFLSMVNRSVTASQACTEKEYGSRIVNDLVPMMMLDVCLLNFYATAGRLGLHQDRDESRASLEKGIPIVSFSVGDSGEFFYGDGREIREAKKVLLESGDVLVFGGPARHIYHGVQSVIPHSAPQSLIKETGLLPGRLNLTFRQF